MVLVPGDVLRSVTCLRANLLTCLQSAFVATSWTTVGSSTLGSDTTQQPLFGVDGLDQVPAIDQM